MTDTAAAESRYASRKWIFGLLVVALAVAMEWFGKLSPLLVEVLKWAYGLYCGFNVTQKAAEWVATLFTTKKESA